MKLALNTATTRGYPLADDIRYCGRHGYDGIEIDTGKLDSYLDEESDLDSLRELLDDNNLAVAALMAFVFRPFGGHEEELERIDRYAGLAKELGSDTLLTFIGQAPPDDMGPDEALEQAVEAARMYGKVAAAHDCRIALEPIGGAPFMGRPEETVAIAEEVGDGSVGIMMDFFHYYKSGVELEAIRRLPAERLYIVHFNDSEDRPRTELTDAHRLYPGLGVIPLVEQMRALEETGYSGFLSVELFRAEYWQRPHEQIIREVKEHSDAVLARL